MKKDINFPPVKGVQVAVAKEEDVPGMAPEWYVFLLNQNNFTLRNILITSKGYGKNTEGEQQKTSVLRHMLPVLEAKEYAKIERIDPSVFHLCSEYWVSYYIDEHIYDKKFIFLPGSIAEENLSRIDLIALPGVLHI